MSRIGRHGGRQDLARGLPAAERAFPEFGISLKKKTKKTLSKHISGVQFHEIYLELPP